MVQFIFDENGRVTETEAISGPIAGGLREEAVRMIISGGDWKPGVWNGYRVKTFKRQPFTFTLAYR